MKLWRCTNESCSDATAGRPEHDFQGDPVCDRCGADGRTPEGRMLIVERVRVHLLCPDKVGPIVRPSGRKRLACQPDATQAPERFTGEPAAVSCPECIASDGYKRLADNPDEVDSGVELFKRIVKAQASG